jgi:hypoxanthine-guanine phosphoribosyltransferase
VYIPIAAGVLIMILTGAICGVYKLIKKRAKMKKSVSMEFIDPTAYRDTVDSHTAYVSQATAVDPNV